MAHACPNPTFRVKKALDLSEKYAESLRSFSITVMKKKKHSENTYVGVCLQSDFTKKQTSTQKFFWKYD